MSELHKPLRRPEFDEIVQGWGSDKFDDLTARIELAAEFKDHFGELTPAEHKIVKAMIARQIGLSIARGDYEPYLDRSAKVDLLDEENA